VVATKPKIGTIVSNKGCKWVRVGAPDLINCD